jgi:hypothetical protein
MRKWFLLGLVLSIVVAVAIPASALTFWYGGDPNYQEGILSQAGGIGGNTMIYDDFSTTGTGWNVHTLMGNFYMDYNASQAYYEIRSGVSEGNGGTLVSSGTFDVTQTYIGSDGGYKVYTLAGNIPAVGLANGTYWLGLAPVSSSSDTYAYAAETSGMGSYGSQVGDGKSYFTGSNFGDYFVATAPLSSTGASKIDFSYGVMANPYVPVSEPASMLVMGMGALSLVPFFKKRK